jgi:hypothetical protein
MSRLICACVWCFAAVIFVITSTTIFANHYLPNSWDAFFAPANVLGEATSAAAPNLETEIEAKTENVTSVLAQTADARALLVANFIDRNDSNHTSPLQPYLEWGKLFVTVADEYGLDFRLLPAIARKESTFCKSNIAQTYYNCFGYGVPASGITEAGKFDSFEEGIRVVAASLKRNYLDQGLTDPEAIMQKYCPPSDGTWAAHLNQWLAEMRFDDKNAAKEATSNTDLTEFIP